MFVIQIVTSMLRRRRHMAAENRNTSDSRCEATQQPSPDNTEREAVANGPTIDVASAPSSVPENKSLLGSVQDTLGARALVSRSRKTSARKAETNRQNAKRSTGPKTERGKAASSRNACKCGVYSAEVVVREGEGQEDIGEYRALLAELQQDLKPVGVLEHAKVETIANHLWRGRRVLRYEKGQILSKTAAVTVQETVAQVNELVLYRLNPRVHNGDLRRSSVGLQTMINLLNIAESEIRVGGWLRQRTYDHLVKYFGDLAVLDNYVSDEDADHPDPKAEKQLRAWIADERENLNSAMSLAVQTEGIGINAKIASNSLPNAPYEILKLERKYQKEINRALDELRHLQATRAEGAS